MKYFSGRIVLLLLVFIQLCACKKDFLDEAAKPLPEAPLAGMADYLKYNYNFTLLYGALQKAGMLESISDTSKKFTLLAPDNAAFAAAGISADSIGKMSPQYLKDWLSYHLLPGTVTDESIPAAMNNKFSSIHNRDLFISRKTGMPPSVNGIPLFSVNRSSDIKVYNGMVHILSRPLTLPAGNLKELLENNPDYSRFTSALRKFGLLDKLATSGPFVVFPVSNDYFMDEASLDAIDTFTHKKYLFDSHIWQDRFFFPRDFEMRPLSDDKFQFVTGTDGAAVVDYGQTGIFCVRLDAGPNPDYYNVGLGDMIPIDPTAPFQLASNGVLMPTNWSLVYPYNMENK